MSEETVKGPIADALKAKIAKIIENPRESLQELIALIQFLTTIFGPKTVTPVFGSSPDVEGWRQACEGLEPEQVAAIVGEAFAAE